MSVFCASAVPIHRREYDLHVKINYYNQMTHEFSHVCAQSDVMFRGILTKPQTLLTKYSHVQLVNMLCEKLFTQNMWKLLEDVYFSQSEVRFLRLGKDKYLNYITMLYPKPQTRLYIIYMCYISSLLSQYWYQYLMDVSSSCVLTGCRAASGVVQQLGNRFICFLTEWWCHAHVWYMEVKAGDG